jgi:hypothetical protein
MEPVVTSLTESGSDASIEHRTINGIDHVVRVTIIPSLNA